MTRQRHQGDFGLPGAKYQVSSTWFSLATQGSRSAADFANKRAVESGPARQ